MLHAYDRATFAHILTLDLDPTLHRLLSERITGMSDELLDHTEIVVVESDDTEEDIIRAIGVSPLTEPIHGIRYDAPGFWPHWDWLTDHGGWFEMVLTFGSAFAYIMLLADSADTCSDILQLCRKYARN